MSPLFINNDCRSFLRSPLRRDRSGFFCRDASVQPVIRIVSCVAALFNDDIGDVPNGLCGRVLLILIQEGVQIIHIAHKIAGYYTASGISDALCVLIERKTCLPAQLVAHHTGGHGDDLGIGSDHGPIFDGNTAPGHQQGIGIDIHILTDKMTEMFVSGIIGSSDQVIITNLRHKKR